MLTNLLAETQKLLNETELSLTRIANGSGIGIEWLRKFGSDRIPNAGVVRVQKLHDFLALPVEDQLRLAGEAEKTTAAKALETSAT